MTEWSVSWKVSNNKSGLLSICRKAGKLKCGMDIVKSACESGEAKAVFVTSDLSAKSLKEIRFSCAKNSVKIYRLDMTMQDAAAAMGKKSGIFAVTDGGFAKSFAKGAEEISADINEFYSEI
jgi:ribosomal protein L7Ae-like RNA K-turn-binding protein